MLSRIQWRQILTERYFHASCVCASRVSVQTAMAKPCRNTDTLRHIKYQEIMKKLGRMPQPGSIDVQVVATGAGGAPKALMVNMDYFRYLFNCGEGTQRIASEHRMKIAKLEHIFITHNSWQNLGGLLGLLLTLEATNVPRLVIHGPPNVEKVITMLRTFAPLTTLTIDKKEIRDGVHEDSAMKIEYVPLYPKAPQSDSEDGEPATKKRRSSPEDMAVVYVCRPHAKPRPLSFEKCVDLGVPRGPLFGQLKDGQTITLPSGKQVHPEDVLEPAEIRRNFMVIEVPSEAYLEDLKVNETLAQHHKATADELVDVVVHLTPPHIMETEIYKEWMDRFDPSTKHMIVNESGSELVHEGIYRLQAKLNLLHNTVFPLLPRQKDPPKIPSESTGNIIQGRTGLRYLLRSGLLRSGKFSERPINTESCFSLNNEKYVSEAYEEDGFKEAYDIVKTNLEEHVKKHPMTEGQGLYPDILFLGTGSAMPNKVRNVSAILVYISSNSCLLMDCGEGTYSQLCRHFGDQILQILREIKSIFISHLHADHHVGLCGLMEARRKAFEAVGERCPDLLMVAPNKIECWLEALNKHVLSNDMAIRLVSAEAMMRCNQAENTKDYDLVTETLQLKEMQTVRMRHRQHPHGLVVRHQDGWKLAYSGDTTPLKFFAKAGMDADILIHEATMEDGLEEEAAQKLHSTTSQAIDIGVEMNAKFILLTHFSQRYAKVPIFSPHFTDRIGIAFDNMRVRPCDLPVLPIFMPALKAMFAEDYADMEYRSQKRERRKEREEANKSGDTVGEKDGAKQKHGQGRQKKKKTAVRNDSGANPSKLKDSEDNSSKHMGSGANLSELNASGANPSEHKDTGATLNELNDSGANPSDHKDTGVNPS